MSYTFIAYKESSVDYCRGCRMGSYSSNFVIYNQIDEAELVLRWSDILVIDNDLGPSENSHTIYILDDGRMVWNDNYATYWFEDDEDYDEEINRKKQENISRIHDLALNKYTDIVITKKKQVEAEKLAKHQKIAEEEKERRRIEYEKLKMEFAK